MARRAGYSDTEPTVLPGVQSRLAELRAQGLDPIEVIMDQAVWETLQAEYRIITPGLLGRLAGRDVLGVRVKVVPTSPGIAIRYFGGLDVVAGA